MICLDILFETKTLDDVMKSLDRNIFWKRFNETIYREATHVISPNVPPKLGSGKLVFLEPVFGQPVPLAHVGGITSSDIAFILDLLWEDRVLFFDLCSRGHLPGCTILLFTIFQITLITPVNG